MSFPFALIILRLLRNKEIRLLSGSMSADITLHEFSNHLCCGPIFGLAGIQEFLMQVWLNPDSVVS
jgi:hypothetical protein